jgi:membrane associated rhomboid family serine protease
LIPIRDNLPTDSFPVVTLTIIVINVLVFLFLQGPSFSLSSSQEVNPKTIVEYGATPYRITHPGKRCELALVQTQTGSSTVPVCQGTADYRAAAQGAQIEHIHQPPAFLTIFTSMFMHGGLFHIGGNMLYLWIFGNNVEDTLGHGRYLLFYLLSGVAAALAQTAVGPSSMVPMVGASGAVSGVLGAYLLLFPHARVTTLIILGFFFRLVQIPAMVVLGFWIVLQLLNGLGSFGSSGGVAFFAHIGGFLVGMGLLYVLKPRARSRAG